MSWTGSGTMDTVHGYSSSSSDDDDSTVLKNTSAGSGAVSEAAGAEEPRKSRGGDAEHSKGAAQDTGTVANRVPSAPGTVESAVEGVRNADTDLTAGIDLNIGDILGASASHTKTKRSVAPVAPITKVSLVQLGDGKTESDRDKLYEQAGEKSSETPAASRRSKKRAIDESAIIDFNVNDFYDENSKLIGSGDLDFEEHEKQNKKVKYYNTTGTNQLSDLMRFSAQHTDKLNSMYDKERSLKKQTAQKYGFKK